MRILFIFLFSFGFYLSTFSNGNFIAGKIDYKFLDTFKIEITVTSHIHACGVNFTTGQQLNFITLANNSYPERQYSIDPTSFEYIELSDSCKNACDGGLTKSGYRRGIFKYIIDLNNFSSYNLYNYQNYCRFKFVFQPDTWPGNTTNIDHGNFYLTAELNTCALPNRNNTSVTNSPVIKREPFFNVIAGNQTEFDYDLATLNNTTDSLYFEMTPISYGTAGTIPYFGIFTYDKPLTFLGFPNANSPYAFKVNHEFGKISFMPFKAGEVTIIGVKVSKYVKVNGNYVYVGFITMHHLVTVYNKNDEIYEERNLRIKSGDTISNFDTLNQIARKYLNMCKNDSVVLKVPNASNYSFQWYKNGDSIPGATTGILVVKDTGLYKVKTSYVHDTTYCFRYSDSILVWSPPKNTAKITLDSTLPLCYGEPVPLITSSYPAYKSFKWFRDKYFLDSTNIDMKLIDTSGNYFLEIIDTATCIVKSNIITPKFIKNKLNLLTEDTLKFCDNVSLKLQAIKGMNSYSWSTGDTTDETLIDNFGMFYLTVKDTNRCTQKDTLHVIKVISPDFNLGNDTLVCDGNAISIPLNITQNKYWKYSWNHSTTDISNSYLIKDTGVYILKVISENLCPNIDSIIVKRTPLPFFDFGNDLQICKNENSNIVLDISGDTNWAYEWENIPNYNKSFIIISDTGTTIAKVTDQHLCTFSDTLKTTYFPEIILQKLVDAFICINPNNPIKIEANSNAKYYKWNQQNIDTFSFFETNIIGQHTLEVSDENGCKQNDTFELKSYPKPTVFIGNDTSFCYDAIINLELENKLDNGYQHIWQNNPSNNTQKYTAKDSGIYTLKIIDTNGCFGGDTIKISRFELKTFVTNDTFICDNNPIIYSVNGTYKNYEWSDDISNNTNQISITNPGLKTLKITDNNNCAFTRNFTVDTLSTPYFSIPDTTICGTEYVLFDLSHIKASVVWNDVIFSKIYEARKEEKVWATATNVCGNVTDSFVIEFCTPQIYIPSAFTPNGDGLNDVFQVLGNVKIKDFFILNRWGEIVFQSNDINHGWNGTYNGSPCQEGVYPYYVFYQDAQKRYNYVKGVVNLMR